MAKLLIVGTFRSDEVNAAHPLSRLREALERERWLLALELDALNAAETMRLARTLESRQLAPEALAQLYRETAGVPLFVVETVRAQREVDPARGTLAPRLRTVIAARLGRLSPSAQGLAEAAAVIGHTFDAPLLAQVSGADEATLAESLDELWARHIVREEGGHRYGFSHDKLREVAYAGLGPAKRRLLHGLVGEALTARSGDGSELGALIGHHFSSAGWPERALPYYKQAAAASARLYANEDALALYERALTLFNTLSAAEQARRAEHAAQLCEGMADILKLQKEHERARARYTEALAHTPGDNARQRARLERKLGTTHNIAQYRYAEALARYDRAEATLGKAPEGAPATWWQEWTEIQICRARTLYWLNEWREMACLSERLEPVVERHGTPLQCGRYFQTLMLTALRRERYHVSEKRWGTRAPPTAPSRKPRNSANGP